jgi:hypothetical protein
MDRIVGKRNAVTAEISRDPWATLDEILGVEPVAEVEEGIGSVAFYGRCSTEDNQDPETSHGWQLSNATKFVEPLRGHVVAEFFDIGQSRSVPCSGSCTSRWGRSSTPWNGRCTGPRPNATTGLHH